MNAAMANLGVASLALGMLTSGCVDSTAPATGALEIRIATTGAFIDVDPDGYFLVVDSDTQHPIRIGAAVHQLVLASGSHVVQLDGLAANCSVTGAATQTIKVTTRSTATAAFDVACVANTGTVQITTSTSGTAAGDKSYAMFLPGVGKIDLPANGKTSFENVRVGQVQLTLIELPGHCIVEGLNPQTVMLAFKGTAEVAFTIRCLASGGVGITVTTSGVDLDSNGYFIELRPPAPGRSMNLALPANGTRSVSQLLPGFYTLTLSGLAPNCTAAIPNPRMIAVAAGEETPVTLEVSCAGASRIAYSAGNSGDEAIYVVGSNAAGAVRLTAAPGTDRDPAWSPDGARIAFATRRDGNSEIYVMNADGTNQVRLTSDASADYRPAWSPDGARIAFVSERDGNAEIYVMNADGTTPRRLTNDSRPDNAPDWSPDGTRIAFHVDTGLSSMINGIWVMNADGSNARQLTSNLRGDLHPAWSPDGTRIAYSASSFYTSDIYLMNADGSARTQVTGGNSYVADPTWSPDGRMIAYGLLSDGCYGSNYYGSPCDSRIAIVGTDGTANDFVSMSYASNPAWRR
ncbi:MAG: hypothetical protein ABIS03_14620 [Gemmatimonadaceae bacterium]